MTRSHPRRRLLLGAALALVPATISLAGCRPPVQSTVPPTNLGPTATRSMIGAQMAVNPKNADNIVVAAVADMGLTRSCIAAKDPNCAIQSGQPAGFFDSGAEFSRRKVYTSFDGGRSWKPIELHNFAPVGHPELYSQNEGGLGVGPDGTFYMSMNTLDWGSPSNFVPYSGVSLSKSTDGGLTWSQPVLIGTPADFPYLTVDQSSGTVYSVSGLGAITPYGGNRSVGGPATPTTYGDAFVASSADGVHWTAGQRTGGTNGTQQFDGSFSKDIAASFGEVAVTFVSSGAPACKFFVGGGAPCTVFQTSRDAGATWTRHRVPFTFVGTFAAIQVAADPTRPGNFTVVALRPDNREFVLSHTSDSGATWSTPTTVGNDGKTHWNPRVSYSADGVLGLVWRTNEGTATPSPYSIWAATSTNGGQTVSPPVQINCCSPAAKGSAPWGGNIVQDFTAIGFGNGNVHAAWGDWRTGERNTFFASVPLPR